jgi:N-acetylglucosaminyl-diphospho-decaprenol L-rhamnosyltransferase
VTPDVVIPTFRARDMLARCLGALRDDPSGKRVIVVDNASGDGTAELVRREFPEVLLLSLGRNAGFGRAVNAGVRAGDGEAIVLVNNDVLVEPGFVDAIVAPLAARPEVGMVAGLTTIPGTGLVDAFGIELDRGLAAYNRGRHRPVPIVAAGDPARPGARAGRPAMPSGGAAAYRRSAWEAAGGFDEALFAYGEDVDVGLRLRAAGWVVAEAPGARGVHLGGATAGFDSPLQRELAGFARGFLLRRYGVLRSRAAPHALALDALVIAWGLARHRTLTPLRARVRGWRAAARGPRLPLSPGAIDETITLPEAIRRLRTAR